MAAAVVKASAQSARGRLGRHHAVHRPPAERRWSHGQWRAAQQLWPSLWLQGGRRSRGAATMRRWGPLGGAM